MRRKEGRDRRGGEGRGRRGKRRGGEGSDEEEGEGDREEKEELKTKFDCEIQSSKVETEVSRNI